METEQKFKTKTGFCHILTDKIVLTRDGIIGNVAELTTGKSIIRLLIVYGLIATLMIYNAYDDFKNQNWVFFGLYLIGGIYLTYTVFKSKNLSATPIIERNKIKNVEFKPANKFLTRSYFKVEFEQNNGKIKSRLIMLPGSLNDGTNETEKAVGIMKKAGLIKNNVG
ncbi:phosphoribosylaminoimidazolesuccinocarboxamide synthase [Winogradskyella marincola]|uniref:Phosphoribosylaminoimidazolesuccinocarboxamide synthase n=1 Tax=Winogradskyella marincola TaxID=3037795 RepID=A0ABT6G5K8_9FLAO|nr:phosphoribosylaminoimidazolesuccinocarboxamide synthase [Winogradskyella sp. YYF002]MDG4717325.1 phosphoribosylaminoimidazolesuccinocarboxamide synthase [Winogradskyella sp. YYF002]